MTAVLLLLAGFALLVVCADQFVAGASAAARRMGVPALVVGLTIVAFGTSAPELAVSLTAALEGANEIAVGNVLGSNIFNLLVVAGLSAVICPLPVDRGLLRRDWPWSAGAALVLLPMLLMGGVNRWQGAILLVLFAFVTWRQVRSARQGAEEEGEIAENAMGSAAPVWSIVLRIVLGLGGIVAGGKLAVLGATELARMAGMSETLIGLTIVAVGTSLPELVTSVVAARRGESGIAMGNVIGSNIFNILLILGVSAAITPLTVLPTAAVDCAVLLGVTMLTWLPARRTGRIGWGMGIAMLVAYGAYMAYAILR